MAATKREALRGIEATLRTYGPQPAKELLTRLVGPFSEEDVWEVIHDAQKMGMIEPAKTFFKTGKLRQRWQLVKGFDRSKLEALA